MSCRWCEPAREGSALTDRAPIFTVVYLLSYSGSTIPSLISGQLSKTFSLPQIALGYGVLALVATLFTVIAARNPHSSVSTTAGGPRRADHAGTFV